MKKFFDQDPDYRERLEKKLAMYEAQTPQYLAYYVSALEDAEDLIVARLRDEFERLVDYARSRLTEDQKKAYVGEMREVVKNIAADLMARGA